MNALVQYASVVALMALLVGCAHYHKPRECCSWREDQLAAARKVALEAAASSEEWQRSGKRVTAGPLELDSSGLEDVFYYPDSRMDILIPTNQSVEDERTGGRVGTKVRVTLDSATALIISIREEVD